METESQTQVQPSSCVVGFHNLFERAFGALGSGVAKHPWITIILCVLFAGGCGTGFAFFKKEERIEKLYIPEDSQALKDLSRGNKYFQLFSRQENLLLVPQTGANILSRECFIDVIKLHTEITSLDNYEKYCLRNSESKCSFINPLEIFNFDAAGITNVTSQLSAAYKDLSLRMRNGRPFYLNFPRMFADVKWSSTADVLISTGALQIYYPMNGKDENYEGIMTWEKNMIQKIETLKNNLSCVSVHISTGRSLSDATSESSGSDISLISITMALMCTFACIMLAKFRNPLMGHALLANFGILSVGLGIVSGLGLALLVGIPFVSMVGVLPFLVIGIGVDDMFIIIDELDRQDNGLPVVETVKRVMAKSGATVTMTTITDLVAFAVSTSTKFNAIRYFCINAALAVTFSYLMIITFFVAFIYFDVRRIKANRRDCLPCCLAPPPKGNNPPWDTPQVQPSNHLMRAWARVLMKTPVRALVVFVSIGLLVASVFGAMEIEESFKRSILVQDGSPYKEYITLQEKFYGNNFEISLIIDENIKYEDPKIQSQILNLPGIVKANSKYYKNVSVSWFESFTSFAQKYNMNISGSNFIPSLKSFLAVPEFAHVKEDVRFTADNSSIAVSRVLCYMKSSSSSTFQKDAMISLRKDLSSDSDLPVYPIAQTFIYLEQYVIILTEVIRNLAIAGGTVFLITCPFLLSITASLIVFFQFVALVFELFAIMWLWGVTLNSVSMINLVMAIGFSVDYSAHIAHAFVTSSEPRPEDRVIDAMSTAGASVMMGGISTFIGMVVTGFASSEIFRIFFKMFLGIVSLGLVHGLCFLPVYLSLLYRWPPIKVNTIQEQQQYEVDNKGFEANKDMELNEKALDSSKPES